MDGIFDGPTAIGQDPSYQPWYALSGLGTLTTIRPTVTAPAPTTTSTGSSMALPLVIGGVAAVALVAVGAYAYMGYYVGKKLGTKWGWFWGGFGPAGLAAMQWYRESKGRTAVPNRRRRRGSRKSRRSPKAWRVPASLEKQRARQYWNHITDEDQEFLAAALKRGKPTARDWGTNMRKLWTSGFGHLPSATFVAEIKRLAGSSARTRSPSRSLNWRRTHKFGSRKPSWWRRR